MDKRKYQRTKRTENCFIRIKKRYENFLDVDGDGDKKESMKKAAQDKK